MFTIISRLLSAPEHKLHPLNLKIKILYIIIYFIYREYFMESARVRFLLTSREVS